MTAFKQRFPHAIPKERKRGGYIPSEAEIENKAQELAAYRDYQRSYGGELGGNISTRPREPEELRETGLWAEARRDLMREHGRGRKKKFDFRRIRRIFDPDHLRDIINDITELRDALIQRDRWIDETYGPMSEAEYDTPQGWSRKDAEQRLEWRQRKKIRGQVKDVDDYMSAMQDPQIYRQLSPFQKKRIRQLAGRTVRKQRGNVEVPSTFLQDPFGPLAGAIVGGAASGGSYVAATKAMKDPQQMPKPIDIYGYGDKNSASMLRLVPDVHGFRPMNLEQSVDPIRGGMVMMKPQGSLVEIQVKYPRHQWEHDILPKMQQDPTNEIDLDNRRIVRRAKNNIATNIFIDGE
jgi:hypothetical protein